MLNTCNTCDTNTTHTPRQQHTEKWLFFTKESVLKNKFREAKLSFVDTQCKRSKVVKYRVIKSLCAPDVLCCNRQVHRDFWSPSRSFWLPCRTQKSFNHPVEPTGWSKVCAPDVLCCNRQVHRDFWSPCRSFWSPCRTQKLFNHPIEPTGWSKVSVHLMYCAVIVRCTETFWSPCRTYRAIKSLCTWCTVL